MNIRRQHESDLSNLSDEELIQSYRAQGNKEIIGILFKRYSHLVFGVCMYYLKNRDSALDAVMGVFENLFDALLRHEVSNFKSWLYTVSKNHCMMQLRKSASGKILLTNDAEKLTDRIMENETPQHLDSEPDVETERITEFVTLLKPGQQQCIRLFYLESHSYDDVAKLTGFSLKEVKSHIQNGKRNLKLLMEGKKKT